MARTGTSLMRPMGSRRSILCSMLPCILLSVARVLHAHPQYWVDPSILGSNRRPPACTEHPKGLYGAHPGVQQDVSIGIAVSLKSKTVKAFCPGETYDIKVTWGSMLRRSLITATQGTFAANTPSGLDTSSWYYPSQTSNLPKCPNRIVGRLLRSASDKLTVPCSASGKLVVAVSSANEDTDRIWQATSTLNVNTACAIAACKSAAFPSPASVTVTPRPIPGVPVPTTTTTTTTTAAPQPAAPPLDRTAASGGGCTPSPLGYTCVQTLGGVQVHYSTGADMPTNPCTQGGILPASNGPLLHMAVQAPVTGYVSLGFASRAGRMAPSDIALGWVCTDQPCVNNRNTFIETYSISSKDVAPTDAVDWALFKGVARIAGNTVICFTRKVNEPQATYSKTLEPLAGLDLIWATSNMPDIVQHTSKSRGTGVMDSFDITGTTPKIQAPPGVVAPAAPSKPSPPPPRTPVAQLPAAPTQLVRGMGACAASALGYSCAQPLGDVILHYSLSKNMPDNLCTQGGAVPATNRPMLHMAVEAPVSGYVGVGFTDTPGKMTSSDAVMGWIDEKGKPVVDAFRVTRHDIGPKDAVPWALFRGVAKAGPNLVACFTRALNEPQATSSTLLDPSQDIELIWASSNTPDWVTHDRQGGGVINLSSGVVTEVVSKRELQIRWHGALMSTAWALLLPLGGLLPRHRWVFGQRKLLGKDAWYPLHLFCQTLGLALTISGFAIAWFYFENPEDGETVKKAHQVLGTIVFSFACLQFVTALARPAPTHPKRHVFNFFHWWCGRLTIVASWVTMYLGISLFHTSIYQASLVQWITPVAVTMGVLVLVDIALTGVRVTKAAASSSPDAIPAPDNLKATVAKVEIDMSSTGPGIKAQHA